MKTGSFPMFSVGSQCPSPCRAIIQYQASMALELSPETPVLRVPCAVGAHPPDIGDHRSCMARPCRTKHKMTKCHLDILGQHVLFVWFVYICIYAYYNFIYFASLRRAPAIMFKTKCPCWVLTYPFYGQSRVCISSQTPSRPWCDTLGSQHFHLVGRLPRRKFPARLQWLLETAPGSRYSGGLVPPIHNIYIYIL